MRRQRWWDSNQGLGKARKMDKSAGRLKQRTIFCFVFLMVFALYLVQYSLLGSDGSDQIKPPIAVDSQKQQQEAADDKSDPCGGRYVYMHDLPPRFNDEMLRECERLSPWIDMCKFIVNAGLGPPLETTEAVFSNSGWYATNQFSMDVIFHNSMKRYECLTNDSSLAAVIYVPFYAGLDISRHLWGHNVSVRDSASLALVDWLVSRPEWNVMNGHDHFLVGGRITWDFRRRSDEESDWGNKLMSLPAVKKMTMLVLESSPWENNDMAIPYPTYFHPSRFSEIADWQKRVRSFDRKYLFSFAGAPRPEMGSSIRGKIMEQCRNSKVGMLLECDLGQSKCQSPSAIMKMFSRSVFCLQPQGDSYTRRSLFDSMLAGCIPVLFHPGSAYTQYFWHLPKNHTTYSVFISENDVREYNVSIEEILLRISAEQVKRMREEVIELIPKIVYADPRSKLHGFKDAFDVSVESVVDKVARLRKELFVEEDRG